MNGLWVDDVNCHICCCKPYAIMYVINSMLCGDDILYVVNHAMYVESFYAKLWWIIHVKKAMMLPSMLVSSY